MKNDNDKIDSAKQNGEEDKELKKQEPEGKDEEETRKLKQKIEELENSYKRALADYQNLQKRGGEERQNWLKIANRELLLRLLPVLDTLMLAYKHDKRDELKVTINQFIDALKAEGITRIDTSNKVFDPLLMEAIAIVDGEDGKVVDEIRVGYMIYDQLLRPSQVKVGKGKEEGIKE